MSDSPQSPGADPQIATYAYGEKKKAIEAELRLNKRKQRGWTDTAIAKRLGLPKSQSCYVSTIRRELERTKWKKTQAPTSRRDKIGEKERALGAGRCLERYCAEAPADIKQCLATVTKWITESADC
jgi:hypothetical protein